MILNKPLAHRLYDMTISELRYIELTVREYHKEFNINGEVLSVKFKRYTDKGNLMQWKIESIHNSQLLNLINKP